MNKSHQQISSVLPHLISKKQIMKATKHLLVYYTFQQEQLNEYNICKYTGEYEQVSDVPLVKFQIKIIHVIKTFPFDALSGNYHFRFKSEFKEQNENVVAWIDISNLESKVPLFNNAVYVKVLRMKNKAHNKLFTQQKLSKIASKILVPQKPTKPAQPAPVQQAQPLNPKDKSPSPTPIGVQRTLSPSPAPPKKPTHDSFFDIPNVNLGTTPSPDNRKKSPTQNVEINLMEQTDSPVINKPSFDLSTKEKLEIFNQQIKDQQEEKERDLKAREELDQIIEKWAYTNKVRNNFRQLIVTVQDIWTYGGWTQITLSQLLTDTDLKKYHNKAMLMFHPDKNRNVDYRRRYLSKRIASQISESYKKL